MPPRLSKRQQRELEELEALAGPSTPTEAKVAESEDEEDDDDVPMKRHVAGFAALFSAENEGEEDDDDEEEPTKTKSRSGKSKKSKKKKKTATSTTQPSETLTPAEPKVIADVSPTTPPPPTVPKSEKKAAKKAKAKAKKAGKDADGLDEIDRALEELSVKHPEFQKPTTSTSSSDPLATGSSRTSPLSQLPAYLSVTLSYLDSDAEMRKFFGSKVVSATKNASGSGTGAAGGSGSGRRAQARLQANQRSNLVRPQQNWAPAQMRDGLSCRSLTGEELEDQMYNMGLDVDVDADGFGVPGERWWTVEYSKRYKSTTLSFMRTVLSGDPQGFYDLLRRAPWHGDTLLQLAEVYRHREEHTQAIDLISRAIFSYERAFIGSSSASSVSFSPLTGLHRLAFPYIPNRPFFLAIHRQVSDFARRGLSRTAFEWAKLLWSLDWGGDPHGACFWLDILGAKIAAGEKKGRNKDKEEDAEWLRDVWEMFEKRRVSLEKEKGRKDLRMDPSVLPGWIWSRALVLRMNGKDEEAATSALVEAVQAFPSVVPLLADKLEVAIPDGIRSHKDFKVEVDGSYLSKTDSIMHLLSHLYVHRAQSLWKDPAVSSWFAQTLSKHFASLPSSLPSNPRRERFRFIFSNSVTLQYAVYRHIIVSESSASSRKFFSFIPRNIQNESGAGLACDPLPPPAGICKSSYDNAFFAGIQDLDRFSGTGRARTRRQREMDERRLARLIPDADFRHQLEAVFERNPMIAQRFPGGIVDFVQHLGQMGPDEMEDVLMAAVAGAMDAAGPPQELQDNREMPGGFVDLVFRDLDDDDDEAEVVGPDEPNQRDEDRAARDRHEDWGDVDSDVEVEGDEDEDEDEDEEEEDIAPMPVRVLRNIIGRFWGGGASTATGDVDSDSDEDNLLPPRDLDGVD